MLRIFLRLAIHRRILLTLSILTLAVPLQAGPRDRCARLWQDFRRDPVDVIADFILWGSGIGFTGALLGAAVYEGTDHKVFGLFDSKFVAKCEALGAKYREELRPHPAGKNFPDVRAKECICDDGTAQPIEDYIRPLPCEAAKAKALKERQAKARTEAEEAARLEKKKADIDSVLKEVAAQTARLAPMQARLEKAGPPSGRNQSSYLRMSVQAARRRLELVEATARRASDPVAGARWSADYDLRTLKALSEDLDRLEGQLKRLTD